MPYYVQAVSSWVYNAVVGGRSRIVRAADVDEAFQSLYATETILMESVFASHPSRTSICSHSAHKVRIGFLR